MNERVRELWNIAGGGTRIEELFPDVVVERFADLIVNACADAVIMSDPSEKATLHEPYRTVMNNVMETFNDEDA